MGPEADVSKTDEACDKPAEIGEHMDKEECILTNAEEKKETPQEREARKKAFFAKFLELKRAQERSYNTLTVVAPPTPPLLPLDKFAGVVTLEDGTRSFKAIACHKDPQILLLPTFLSEAECDHLVALAEVQGWARSATARKQEGQTNDRLTNVTSDTRTSYTCTLDPTDDKIVHDIEGRVASLVKYKREHVERFSLVRYHPGEYFNEHHDGGFRAWTVFAYLNDIPDEDDGGQTVFPYLGVVVKPVKGAAVVWRNLDDVGEPDMKMRHAGRPPMVGVKYGMNCFVNTSPLREISG